MYKLNSDGRRIVIARPAWNSERGEIVIARKNHATGYAVFTRIQNTNGNEGDNFGSSIDITSDAERIFTATAFADAKTRTDVGSVTIFDVEYNLTPTPTQTPTETPTETPTPFTRNTIDFNLNANPLLRLQIKNITNAQVVNGKSYVGSFSMITDSTVPTYYTGTRLGSVMNRLSYMNDINYLLRVEVINKTTNEIREWANSLDSGVRKPQSTGSLESNGYPGLYFFKTASSFDFSNYELYDIKFETSTNWVSRFSNCTFDLDLYNNSDNTLLGTLHYDATQGITDGGIVGGYYPKTWWGSYQNTKY